MRLIITLVAVAIAFMYIFFTSLDNVPHHHTFYTALDNFTYVADPEGEDIHVRYTHHDRVFLGDCEDFAFTLQSVIGGEVWAVTHPGDQYHAVLLVGNYVYDNYHKRPTLRSDYPEQWLHPIKFNGTVIDNGY